MILSYVMCTVLVYYDFQDNALPLILFTAVLSGQGSCLVLLTCLQTMLDFHTIVCGTICNGILLSYYMGAKGLTKSITVGLLPNVGFTWIVFMISMTGLIVYTVTGLKLLTDVD